jgi:hypothetical protein
VPLVYSWGIGSKYGFNLDKYGINLDAISTQ